MEINSLVFASRCAITLWIGKLAQLMSPCMLQNLQDVEANRQRQVRELEQSYQQDRQHTENLHDKKVSALSVACL